MGGKGMGMNNGGIFRAIRYAADYEAFKGRKLEPLSETDLATGIPFSPPDGPPQDMPPPPPNAPYPPNFRKQPSPAPTPAPGQ